ncbi:MAG: Antitoxin VapB2 [Turneriella sp.]|nr:Antitoxin VapB2 [Turneriella sp.]
MKTANLFKNGDSQALRLPKEYRFNEKEVLITKHSDILLVMSKTTNPWDTMAASLEKFGPDIFENGRKQPPTQRRKRI